MWLIETLVQHVGVALQNIDIRESTASNWLNKIETFEYRWGMHVAKLTFLTMSSSVMGSVVSAIKTLLECEVMECSRG